MSIKDWTKRPDEEIVWGMCEMKAATVDIYKGQKPWVVYFNEQLENGQKIEETDMKQVYKFVVDEQAAKIFHRENLKAGDVVHIEIEFVDDFKDDVYVSGYKYAAPASAIG